MYTFKSNRRLKHKKCIRNRLSFYKLKIINIYMLILNVTFLCLYYLENLLNISKIITYY